MPRTDSHLIAELHAAGIDCSSPDLERVQHEHDMLTSRLRQTHSAIARMLATIDTGETLRPDIYGDAPVYATVRELAEANTLVLDLLTAQRIASRLVARIESAVAHKDAR